MVPKPYMGSLCLRFQKDAVLKVQEALLCPWPLASCTHWTRFGPQCKLLLLVRKSVLCRMLLTPLCRIVRKDPPGKFCVVYC